MICIYSCRLSCRPGRRCRCRCKYTRIYANHGLRGGSACCTLNAFSLVPSLCPSSETPPLSSSHPPFHPHNLLPPPTCIISNLLPHHSRACTFHLIRQEAHAHGMRTHSACAYYYQYHRFVASWVIMSLFDECCKVNISR